MSYTIFTEVAMQKAFNIGEAKTNLSKLIAEALAGNDIVLANRGKPVVKLIPVDKPEMRKLGFINGSVPDSFFEPLSEEELEAWGL
jgi:prevent-host-death family protein